MLAKSLQLQTEIWGSACWLYIVSFLLQHNNTDPLSGKYKSRADVNIKKQIKNSATTYSLKREVSVQRDSTLEPFVIQS